MYLYICIYVSLYIYMYVHCTFNYTYLFKENMCIIFYLLSEQLCKALVFQLRLTHAWEVHLLGDQAAQNASSGNARFTAKRKSLMSSYTSVARFYQ